MSATNAYIGNTQTSQSPIKNQIKQKTQPSINPRQNVLIQDGSFDFSGALVYVAVPWNVTIPIILEGLIMLNFSEHRERYPVISFGVAGIKTFTLGHPMIAGSLAFNVPNAFTPVIDSYAQWRGIPDDQSVYLPVNELPPINISIVTVNDGGVAIQKLIKGLVLVDSGSGIDIDRPVIGENFSFMATEITQWLRYDKNNFVSNAGAINGNTITPPTSIPQPTGVLTVVPPFDGSSGGVDGGIIATTLGLQQPGGVGSQ